MLIEELKAIKKAEWDLKKGFYSTVEVDEGYIFVSLHCHLSIESLMPARSEDKRTISWLQENGYQQVNRINCSERSEDRADVIIYHYRKYYTPEGDDIEFIKDWKNPEFRYCLFQVYRKWGIIYHGK